jgi:energy-coupling factor transporter transmembrane protein EcfT
LAQEAGVCGCGALIDSLLCLQELLNLTRFVFSALGFAFSLCTLFFLTSLLLKFGLRSPPSLACPSIAILLNLGATVYRIHGTNAPETIGQAVSSGCFRLVNDDVADLYSRVPIGTKVLVQHQ